MPNKIKRALNYISGRTSSLRFGEVEREIQQLRAEMRSISVDLNIARQNGAILEEDREYISLEYVASPSLKTGEKENTYLWILWR